MTIPGKRPATKLFPENSSASLLAVSVMSMSSRVLGEVDAVANGEDCVAMSLVVDALIELVDNSELMGVVVIEDVVAAA
jgi:Na+-transporting NADH:ubiquinone oxidoreductase subunit NqrD